MTNQTDQFIETAAPIPAAILRQFFENKELKFKIDYTKSTIKGKVLLIYLANLNVPSDISFDKDNKETLFELLNAYMSVMTINEIPTLNRLVAEIILRFKGVAEDDLPWVNELPNDVVQEFIESNLQLVLNWSIFIDSSLIFIMNSISSFRDKYNILDTVEKVEDMNVIGLNVVNMFNHPSFMESYFSVNTKPILYNFVMQFSKNMFKGQSLVAYVNCSDNFITQVAQALAAGVIPLDPEELQPNQ